MNRIAETYNQDPQREWSRLVRDPYHTLEFRVTWHYLQKYLPPTGKVLDGGGGPGRYALELCRAGYQVNLFDLSARLLEVARDKFRMEPEIVQRRLLESVEGDIRDLSYYPDSHFDVVLCLGGPLTHISEKAGREQAFAELVRVTRPGGIIAVAVVRYLAVLRTIMEQFTDELVIPSFQTLLDEGDTTGPTNTIWHFYRAAELRQQAEAHGLITLEMAGCQGLSTGMIAATNALAQDQAKWQRWLDLVVDTANDPALVDLAEHILYIGRKSG